MAMKLAQCRRRRWLWIPACEAVRESPEALDRRRASFETAASRPPQDEETFLVPSTTYLILRSARRARPEGRTTPVQLSQRSSFGFLHTLLRRNDTVS